MNVASEELPAVKFMKPDTVKTVEICRTTGLLATPQCADAGIYTEYATEAQMPKIRCDVHGGGIRNYAKEYGQEEWPRAAAAVDPATVRPIAVLAPTLLGLSDVYNSVRPGAVKFDESIPVAKAVPVTHEESTPAEGETVDPNAPPKAEPVAAIENVPEEEPEVRKAEAVNPLDSPLDEPAIKMPEPPPINF